MKTVLLINSHWAMPCLDELLRGYELIGLGIPAKSRETIKEVRQLFPGTKDILQLLKWKTLAQDLSQWLNRLKPTVVLVVTFPFRIPAEILRIPPYGVFNFHFGQLPGYAGNHPVFWQIKNREPYAYISVHQMDAQIDTGPLVLSQRIPIAPDDTQGLLSLKYAFHCPAMLKELMSLLEKGRDSLTFTPQVCQNTDITDTSNPGIKDVTIDWEKQDSHSIMALVRATNPWNNGAVTSIRGICIHFIDVSLVKPAPVLSPGYKPGTIVALDEINGLQVACCDQQVLRINFIYMDTGFFPGKKLLSLGICKDEPFT